MEYDDPYPPRVSHQDPSELPVVISRRLAGSFSSVTEIIAPAVSPVRDGAHVERIGMQPVGQEWGTPPPHRTKHPALESVLLLLLRPQQMKSMVIIVEMARG